MQVYHFLSRVFPGSFAAKVAFLTFVSMQVPAIALILVVWGRGGPWDTASLLRLLLFTEGIAMVLTAGAIAMVLTPVFVASRAVAAYASNRSVNLLPGGYRDEVGRLMSNINALMLNVGEELDAAVREAETDPLTGLLNRRGFERGVPPEVVGTVIHLDLDHFKEINDEWGHARGDEVLVAVSDALSAALRTRDVLARMGGEEFAVFVEESVEARALDVAERIRDRMRSDVVVQGRPVTASIGVAVAEWPVSRSVLLEAADSATYAAKAAGRDRIVVARGAIAA